MNKILLKSSVMVKAFGLLALSNFLQTNASAQCGFGAGLGCPNSDYDNYGYSSTTNAKTLEYDNYVSAFHSTLVRDSDGKIQIWGQNTGIIGNSLVNLVNKTEIKNANFPGLTGTPIKATMGSNTLNTQTIVLTTTGLHVWGNRGAVIINDGNITPDNFVTKIAENTARNINSYGLPGTLTPTDVKMMFATHQTLAIVSCDGNAYVLSRNVAMRGAGTTNSDANSNMTWYQVKLNATTNLTNVVAVRGTTTALIALTNDNKVYTWGDKTLLGNETSSAQAIRNFATAMTLPETGTVKMIGATTRTSTGTNTTSYYILFTNGKLWAMGNNQNNQLGDWTTDASPSSATRKWVQPKYPASGSNSDNSSTTSGAVMDDIVWISPNEHDNQNAAINVINRNGRLWNFGTNAGIMLGRTPSSQATTSNINPLNPGQPFASQTLTNKFNFNPTNSVVLAVETGGHTTLISTQCEQKFAYVGHATSGSASSGTEEGSFYDKFSYTATTNLNVCGAEGAPDVMLSPLAIYNTSNGNLCSSQSVELTGLPAGGTFEVVSGPATLANNKLSFTATSGSVLIRYTINNSPCNQLVTEKTLTISSCSIYKVKGTIWNDKNENAVINSGENTTNGAILGHNTGLWANLVNSHGVVTISVPVNEDGTYELPTTENGTYSVVISNTQVGKDIAVPQSALPLKGWMYTGNSKNGVPCVVTTCTNNPSTISTIVVNGADVSGINFAIKSDGTLPVSILNFDVYKNGNGIALNWSTATEQNNAGFEIQRSKDSKHWETIGFVKSNATNGKSSFLLNYDFEDKSPLKGSNYYRLKQIDFDKNFDYSLIRMVRFDIENKITIFPNPSQGKFTILGLEGDEMITIFDNNGRFIKTVANTNEVVLDELNDGIYFISIKLNNGQLITRKVIVRK